MNIYKIGDSAEYKLGMSKNWSGSCIKLFKFRLRTPVYYSHVVVESIVEFGILNKTQKPLLSKYICSNPIKMNLWI